MHSHKAITSHKLQSDSGTAHMARVGRYKLWRKARLESLGIWVSVYTKGWLQQTLLCLEEVKTLGLKIRVQHW